MCAEPARDRQDGRIGREVAVKTHSLSTFDADNPPAIYRSRDVGDCRVQHFHEGGHDDAAATNHGLITGRLTALSVRVSLLLTLDSFVTSQNDWKCGGIPLHSAVMGRCGHLDVEVVPVVRLRGRRPPSGPAGGA